MGGERKALELRFKGAVHALSGLPSSPLIEVLTRGEGGWSHLEETLFDTPDRALAAVRTKLLLRCKAGGQTQIVTRLERRKTNAAGKWRTAIAKKAPFPADTGDPGIDDMLALHGPNLRKVMHFSIDRWKASFPFRKSTLAFKVDLATVSIECDGTKSSFPIADASLRLKKGNTKDLFEAARLLLSDGALRLDALTRHQAATAIAEGRKFSTRRRVQARVEEGVTAGDLLARSLSAIAERIILLQPLIIDARVEEGVHQMRVELRRMRAIERVFRKTAAGTALGDLAIRARKISRILGPARDWDVFTEKTLPIAAQNEYAEEGFARLQMNAQMARAQAWTSAVAEISGKDFSAFAVDIFELAHTRPWAKKNCPLLKKPVKKFAVKAQDRALRKTQKVAASIDVKDPASLHALRIAVKKLRYCNQLFRNVYSKKRRSAYMSAITMLQEGFGDINDAVTAQRLVNVISRGGGEKVMRASGFLSGYYAAQLDAASKAIETSWNSFEAMPPFWRKTETKD